MISVVSHLEMSPQSLKFPPKWRDALDASHVNQLAVQIASGQVIYVTANVENWVLKGRHTAAAYLKVQKGDLDLGIAPHPKLKVPVIRVTGRPQEERILELSSIVNQRKASPVEEGAALKEMCELLEQKGREGGQKPSKQAVVEEVALATGQAPRTIAKKIRDATPEAERKPSKPRGKKLVVQNEKGDPFDEVAETFVPATITDTTPVPPQLEATHALERCLELTSQLRRAQGDASNALFALADVDTAAATDQIMKDQVTLDEIADDYRGYIRLVSGEDV